MYIRVLGAAAGGGYPQWNCNHPNSRSARNSARMDWKGEINGLKEEPREILLAIHESIWFFLSHQFKNFANLIGV